MSLSDDFDFKDEIGPSGGTPPKGKKRHLKTKLLIEATAKEDR